MPVKVDVPLMLLRGDVDEGYGAVADAFRRNFAERGEVGAACAVFRDGKKVVDLWGGYRDGAARKEWREDTVVVLYSATKGVSGLALALAHSRGLLDYDERVAAYWPEFAWRDKGEITARSPLPILPPGSATATRRTAWGSPCSTIPARWPSAMPSITTCSESGPSMG